MSFSPVIVPRLTGPNSTHPPSMIIIVCRIAEKMSSKYSGDISSDLGNWLPLVSSFIAGMILSLLISDRLSTWKSSLESKIWTLAGQLGHRDGASAPPLESDNVHGDQQVITSTLSDDEDSSSYHSVDSNISEVSSLCEEDTPPVHSLDSNNSEECVDSHKQVYRYDVFLSFRGPDVRNTFVDHLFERLERRGIFTFKDNVRLKKGKRIKAELMDAIRDSRLAIVVFSSTYPTSTWCLDEMSTIADLHRQNKQIVVPVFYDVPSSDVGSQTGPYEVHFNSERFRKFSNRVARWKVDMKYLAKVCGFSIVDSNRPETTHLEEITSFVAKELNHRFTLLASDLIGIQPRVAELERRLNLTSGNVAFQILEIWGMSGIGKTVLAMILYDRISHQFDACCFIQGVNGIYTRHANACETATTNVQKQILRQLFQEQVESDDPAEIAKMLQNRLCNRNLPKRVLIVLDDVGDPKQWDDLGIVPDSLGLGSRVVITTRFQHILNVNTAYEIHEVQLLNDDEALELFQRKAFKIDCHSLAISDVSRRIIEYAQCLPSAIIKLGYYFNQKAEAHWERCFQRWREYPEEKYMNSLQEKDYEVLNEDEKMIFLDIACFFKGKNKKYVEHILGSRISDPHLAIQEIRKKSLIKIRNHEIHMHQILQDLGKKIVRGNNKDEPKCWSRLWNAEDFQEVLIDMEGNKVQAIVLDEDVSKYMKIGGLSELRDLRLLILHHHKSSSEKLTFRFNKLCYLSWHGFSYTSLSLCIWSNLAELNLPNSSIGRLWEGSQAIPNLKRMNLRNSRDLVITPNFACCQGLVRLDLTGCINLTEVHDSIGLLRELNYLSLRECSSLSLLDFGPNCQLSSLRTLLLSGCTNLQQTPDFTELSNLRYLDLERCTSLSTMHESIGTLATLKYLSLRGCKNLVHAPYILNGNSSLLILDLSGCMMITNLPRCRRKFAPSSCLESLMFLSPVFLEPQRILDFVGELMFFDGEWICSKLAYLNLAHCHELRRFPEASFHGLHEMKGTLERYPQLSVIGQDYIFSASTV
ncbi:disease resistance protein Roq1-like isoform X2 [Arachis duranensis]|uniref:Disease resistance protein Roq1-like isoform X2 n=1 Tax=Arachis duranensis TaxID=130453 RepID=A0A6P4C2F0_ARADU|nr:disease resistance protein Roq1-like isoform X2 [Arachis duranensis]